MLLRIRETRDDGITVLHVDVGRGSRGRDGDCNTPSGLPGLGVAPDLHVLGNPVAVCE